MGMKFRTGDVVRLKSDFEAGCPMTVLWLEEAENAVQCGWTTADGSFENHSFDCMAVVPFMRDENGE